MRIYRITAALLSFGILSMAARSALGDHSEEHKLIANMGAHSGPIE